MTASLTGALNLIWSHLMVDELLRNGIDTFIVCPGSRSSPLAIAIAENSKARSWVHFDERGAAFFALGYVSASRKPAALVCTSGTAVANFFPAIIECSKKKLPLFVLTADRPPELRKTGADQTIEQPGIFGEYVRFQYDMPCPTQEIPAAMVLTTIDQAVYRAQYPLPGPVHINCMFREPLVSMKADPDLTEYLAGLDTWGRSRAPFTAYHAPVISVLPENIKIIAKIFNGSRKGMVVVGKLNSDTERSAIVKLAELLQWPIATDVTSGLRLSRSKGPVVHYFNHMLLSQKFIDHLNLDIVLQ